MEGGVGARKGPLTEITAARKAERLARVPHGEDLVPEEPRGAAQRQADAGRVHMHMRGLPGRTRALRAPVGDDDRAAGPGGLELAADVEGVHELADLGGEPHQGGGGFLLGQNIWAQHSWSANKFWGFFFFFFFSFYSSFPCAPSVSLPSGALRSRHRSHNLEYQLLERGDR